MKKTILIISILSIFFLTGCGFFNLSNFILPDNIKFLITIETLNTPEKICNYMKENFIYKANPVYSPDPYTLWRTKKGDCNDMSTFGVFVANYHNYTTYQIHIYYKGTLVSHYIAIYVEDDEMAFSDNWLYTPMQKDSFAEIVDYDCWLQGRELKNYIVYNYKNNIVEEGYK